MDNKEFLAQLADGRVRLKTGKDGLPPQINEPIKERMEFVRCLCHGYMRLYNRMYIHERTHPEETEVTTA